MQGSQEKFQTTSHYIPNYGEPLLGLSKNNVIKKFEAILTVRKISSLSVNANRPGTRTPEDSKNDNARERAGKEQYKEN